MTEADERTIEATLAEVREKMAKAIVHTQADFSSIRTGRAVPALIEKLMVEYYGSPVPLQQLAGITVPEARVLVVSAYDKSAIRAIEKAIMNSDLGINPSNDGEVIRLVFPQLTAERRGELVKVVKHKAEEGRIAIRNLRRAARHEFEAMERGSHISSDDLEWAERELERITHEQIAEMDRVLARKEQELLEV